MDSVSNDNNSRRDNMKEMSKRDIRLEVLEKRARMSPEERASKSRAIGDRLMKTGQWADAKTVFLYMSLPGEVETDRLIGEAWSQGKQVAVPKVTKEGLVFSKLDSFEELSEGSFHVREPKMIREISDGSALVIMPGVAFDKNATGSATARDSMTATSLNTADIRLLRSHMTLQFTAKSHPARTT